MTRAAARDPPRPDPPQRPHARRPTRARVGSRSPASPRRRSGSPEIARRAAAGRRRRDRRVADREHRGAAPRRRVVAPMTLIRSPMLSQVDRVVQHADVSLNTELDVIDRLSARRRRQGRRHGVVLMVELGDLREGILPGDLDAVVRRTLSLPAHRRCAASAPTSPARAASSPDDRNMAELSALVASMESTFGLDARHRVRRQLGQPRLGPRLRATSGGSTTSASASRSCSAASRSAAARSTGSTPTRSRSSPR